MRLLVILFCISFCTAYLWVAHKSGKELENSLEGTFAKDGKKGKVFIILFYIDSDDKIKLKN